MDIKELSSIIKDGGIVGAGGAGFPTYAKLDSRIKTALLNCAECEPLLKLHRQLLKLHAEEILSAFEVILDTVGAQEGIVGIKAEYTETIRALDGCIDRHPKIRIHTLAGAYPMGDEVVLIREATGITVRPGSLPIEAGVAVFNVETVYNISRAMQGLPVTDKVVTVVGEVNESVTLRVPLGMKLGEVVKAAGGTPLEDPCFITGGPMMGRFGQADDPVTKTTNAILVLRQDHPLVLRMRTPVSVSMKRAASVCCQCRTCTDMCPRHQLGHPIQPHLFMRAASNRDLKDADVFLNTFFCSGCGVCEMYACPQGLAPRTLIGACKAGLRASGVKAPRIEAAGPGDSLREMRRVPEQRLEARLSLTAYDAPAPLRDEVIAARRVYLRTSQHIGAPAKPVVKAGDRVQKGQLIAAAADGLSVPLHASITGKVAEVTDKLITLEA